MSLDLAVDSGRDLTLELCTFLADLTYDDLPAEVVHMAKASILNSIGCGLSSSPATLPAVAKLWAALDVEAKGGARPATVLAMAERAGVDDAAFVNGSSMTARFYDDTHLATVVHPSGPPLAAILAYAEIDGVAVSGENLILAFVVGVETTLAVANALGLGPYRKGWHMTGMTGSFGAAAAVAKLAGLHAHEMAAALGHASSMASGTRAVFATDTLIMHAGRAAQNGLLAARLAREGFGSTANALEKWVKLISDGNGGQLEKLTALLEERKRRWVLMENAFKPYPGGIVVHPLVDAGIEAHAYFFTDKNPSDALDLITSIQATVTPLTLRLCSVKHPQGSNQILFSTYHGLAVGLVHGKGGLREFSECVAADPLITALRDRISFVTDDSLKDDQCRVTFCYRAADKTEKTKEIWVEHAVGSLENPMTDEQLETKFKDQAVVGGLSPANTQKAVSHCWKMDELDDIRSLMRLLAPTA
jgi:aconitate decarboxylase